MKIADVLSFMSIEINFSWSKESKYPCEYSPDVDISKIPVEYLNGCKAPSNEEFHKAAQRFIELNSIPYPTIEEYLEALRRQVKLLSDRFEIPQDELFTELCDRIDRIEQIKNKQ